MNPLQLALRVLRVDSRSRMSAILTAVGVALATSLIVFLITLPQAAEVRANRSEWQQIQPGSERGSTSLTTQDYVGSKEITRIDLDGTPPADWSGPPAPGPGEVLLSPELAKLAEELPPDKLADRFPGRVVGTVDMQHLRFPEQLVAVVGHPKGSFDPANPALFLGHYEADVLLALLAWVGVVLLTVPCLVLVSAAARLTAARRERRLAALRLAGATPRQVVATVTAETAIAALGGTVLGVLLGLPLRYVFMHVPWGGGTWLVSDFTPSWMAILGVGLGIPLLVVLAAVFGLRRVVRTPLGAVMEHSGKRPKAWRLLTLVVVGAGFVLALGQADGAGGLAFLAAALAAVVVSAQIVGPWITGAIGALFARVWRRPAMLLAGRRLVSDPKAAYRSASGVVLAVFTGCFAMTMLSSLESASGTYGMYKASAQSINVPPQRSAEIAQRLAKEVGDEGIDAVVTRSVEGYLKGPGGQMSQVLIMDCEDARAASAVKINSCAGPPAVHASASMGWQGTNLQLSVSGGSEAGELVVTLPERVPVEPVEAINPTGLNTVVDAALVPDVLDTAVNTITVAPSHGTDPELVRTALATAAPGESVEASATSQAKQALMLSDLNRVTAIGLGVAALIAGCSAAITAATSVVDRRRTFGALIAAGTPVRVLGRALRTEAGLPALVATTGAGVAGVAVASGMMTLFDEAMRLNVWSLAPIVLGVVVALIASSTSGPMLRRVSAEPFADE